MAADQMWTVKSALDWTRGYLERHGDEHPRLSAEWLLCHATGFSRVEVYMNYDRPLDDDERARLREGVMRRGRGEPLQYVTGEMAFRHLVLKCAPGVLIPRPETEVLVDCVLDYLDDLRGQRVEEVRAYEEFASLAKARRDAGGVEDDAAADGLEEGDRAVSSPNEAGAAGNVEGVRPSDEAPNGLGEEDVPSASIAAEQPDDAGRGADAPEKDAPDPAWAQVLEIGTGTGCIALSIAGERAGVHVCATDVSEDAFSCAMRNRDALGQERAVDLYRCDMADDVPGALEARFDVLVSNPPYIPSAIVDGLPREVVGFEPRLALDGGADGLDAFRAIVERAVWALRPGGLLACELHEDCLQAAACEPAVTAAFDDVRVVRDLTGRDRILLARLKRL